MRTLLAVTLALVNSTAALAGPAMQFNASPARAVDGRALRALIEERIADRMIVIVKEPAACGERLSAPGFRLAGSRLELLYEVPAAGAAPCLATAVFTFRGLPEREFTVRAQRAGVRAPGGDPGT